MLVHLSCGEFSLVNSSHVFWVSDFFSAINQRKLCFWTSLVIRLGSPGLIFHLQYNIIIVIACHTQGFAYTQIGGPSTGWESWGVTLRILLISLQLVTQEAGAGPGSKLGRESQGPRYSEYHLLEGKWALGLEEGMASHSSILAWRITWTEEPGRLQSIGLHRVGHHWSDLACKNGLWVGTSPWVPHSEGRDTAGGGSELWR